MKKKILIVNNNMNIGGIQKSLVNLLTQIHTEYDITLLLLYKSGELMEDIPSGIEIREGNVFTRIMGMTHAQAKERGILTFVWRSFWTVVTRVLGTKTSFSFLSLMQKVKGEFDAAISFMQNDSDRIFYGGCNEFVLNAVKAKQKITFVHCDFKNYDGNNSYNKSIYKKFDKIAAVSKSVRMRFAEVMPDLADRTYTVYNCYDFDSIRILADAYETEYSEGKINLFSASRISKEKGIIRMIPILKSIKDKGIDFIWRIAGGGIQTDEAKRMIKELNLTDNIILLGELKNPYPYFKNSDILLVPSYAEAAPMVFYEAKALGLPVFSTDTTSAYEMIGNDGWVCENSDEMIEKALFDVLKDTPSLKVNGDNLNNEKARLEFIEIIG